jgi:hypothetical protein
VRVATPGTDRPARVPAVAWTLTSPCSR